MARRHTKKEIAERTAEAVRLRAAGMSYERIAEHLGLGSRGSVHTTIKRALERYEHVGIEEARTLAAMRLDQMLVAVWSRCISGDLKAIDIALKIESQRAKLLGLNAPTQIDITHTIRRIAEEHGMDPDQALTEAAEILREMGL